MLSVKGFFWVASLSSLSPFVPVCLSSVSDPSPYPSCLCLPLRTSFSRSPSSSRREGAAASSGLSLRTFVNIHVWSTMIILRSTVSKDPTRSGVFFVNEKFRNVKACSMVTPNCLDSAKHRLVCSYFSFLGYNNVPCRSFNRYKVEEA